MQYSRNYVIIYYYYFCYPEVECPGKKHISDVVSDLTECAFNLKIRTQDSLTIFFIILFAFKKKKSCFMLLLFLSTTVFIIFYVIFYVFSKKVFYTLL